MKWIIRHGLAKHVCSSSDQLMESSCYEKNGFKMVRGYLEWTHDGIKRETVPIADVVVDSQLKNNIVSADILLDKGFQIKYHEDLCEIYRKGVIVLCAYWNKNDYTIREIEEYEGCRQTQDHSAVPENTELQYITHEPEEWRDVQKLEEREQKIWKQAMDEEMKCLFDNGVLQICEKPKDEKIIGSRWTYCVKTDEKGKISRVRARLVARGCNQREGVDFFETFAPVVSHSTIRIFLTIAGQYDMRTNHCDIASAFLYGELHERIFMKGPESEQEPIFYKLNKAMYGLRQAAYSWNQRIHKSLSKIGYVSNNLDTCLYSKNNKIFLLIHVDDLLIASADKILIDETINQLSQEYTLKNLGEATKYLGICLERDREELCFKLNQTPMIMALADQYGLLDSKPVSTPMSTDFLKNQEYNESKLLSNNHLYQRAVGSLLYLGLVSRPDIHLAVNVVSRRTSQPTHYDWEGVKRIIKYLRSTKDYKLKLGGKDELALSGYSDADWGGDHETRKSTSGHLIYLGNSLIDWKSRRQKCVSLSTAESEFVSSTEAIQNLCWVNDLLKGLHIEQNLPLVLYSDNMSSIHMLTAHRSSKKSKHIDIKYHYIKDLIGNGIIEVKYCPTEVMKADIMTKPLGKVLHNTFCHYLGLSLDEQYIS